MEMTINERTTGKAQGRKEWQINGEWQYCGEAVKRIALAGIRYNLEMMNGDYITQVRGGAYLTA